MSANQIRLAVLTGRKWGFAVDVVLLGRESAAELVDDFISGQRDQEGRELLGLIKSSQPLRICKERPPHGLHKVCRVEFRAGDDSNADARLVSNAAQTSQTVPGRLCRTGLYLLHKSLKVLRHGFLPGGYN